MTAGNEHELSGVRVASGPVTATASTAPATTDDVRLEARFKRVAQATRDNLGVAIDLVLVHNERTVRGRQPRASLNRAIVVAAVGAWDRFVADTRSAFTAGADVEHWYAGADQGQQRQLYAAESDGVLTRAGALEDGFLARFDIVAATNWAGVRIKGMEELHGCAPGGRSGLTFAQHLNQWITLRNALAHGSLRRLLERIPDPARWTDRAIGDPYASTLHGRYRLWESDAEGDGGTPIMHRLVGATVQAGCARSCLALIVQLTDWLMVDICSVGQRSWDAEALRLPREWFTPNLPVKFRGADMQGYVHQSLWGGPELRRRQLQ